MLLFIVFPCLLSHKLKQFKYISCYSLSAVPRSAGICHRKFKYISCYSLSNTVRSWHRTFTYSNTSHVTLYLDEMKELIPAFEFKYISCYSLSTNAAVADTGEANSNTSHVTLYRNRPHYHRRAEQIQIHLMLLFINSFSTCSGRLPFIQIHLMLLFIECPGHV